MIPLEIADALDIIHTMTKNGLILNIQIDPGQLSASYL